MAQHITLPLAIAALAVALLWSQRGGALAAAALPPAVALAPEAQPVAVGATPASAAPTVGDSKPVKTDRSQQLELPDGTFVAALNGATDAAPLQQYWGGQIPWSPIVGVERNTQGVDWYRHANGSYSTTQMVWRSDLNRHAAMTRVGHPGPAVTPAVGQ